MRVRQGCIFAPNLHCIATDWIMWHYVNIRQPTPPSHMLITLHCSLADCNWCLSSLSEASAQFGLKISRAKTILDNPSSGPALFFIRFWYLRCCGCPWNRGRQHLATPLKTCQPEYSLTVALLNQWQFCISWQFAIIQYVLQSSIKMPHTSLVVCDGISALWLSVFQHIRYDQVLPVTGFSRFNDILLTLRHFWSCQQHTIKIFQSSLANLWLFWLLEITLIYCIVQTGLCHHKMSVRPSDAYILSKRLHISSNFLHHWLATPF